MLGYFVSTDYLLFYVFSLNSFTKLADGNRCINLCHTVPHNGTRLIAHFFYHVDRWSQVCQSLLFCSTSFQNSTFWFLSLFTKSTDGSRRVNPFVFVEKQSNATKEAKRAPPVVLITKRHPANMLKAAHHTK